MDHETFVRGSEIEGWWFICTACEVPPNGFSLRQAANEAAAAHRRAARGSSTDTEGDRS